MHDPSLTTSVQSYSVLYCSVSPVEHQDLYKKKSSEALYGVKEKEHAEALAPGLVATVPKKAGLPFPELSLVLKADVNGSLEALLHVLANYPNTQCKLDLVHYDVGDVSESDVELAAAASNGTCTAL